MSYSLTNPNTGTERYLAVDALRGIAALAVTLFHLHDQAFQGVRSGLLTALSAVFQYGYLGVPVFFVISGFVIAATVKPPDVTFRYMGKFAVKRSIRLDPPYWLSIALELLLIYLTINLFQIHTAAPTPQQIAANVFYLQNLLGLGDIAANYWTLCLEVQFYLFLVLVFACANRFSASDTQRMFVVGAFVISGAASLLIGANLIANPLQGLFISHWYLFLLGSVTYWTGIKRSVNKLAFFAFCVLVIIVFVLRCRDNYLAALNSLLAVVTALFLYFAATRGKMSTWLNSRVLLYLGAISYSLYLFHAIVSDRFLAFVTRILLPRLGMPIQSTSAALLLLLAALAVSILTAHLVYLFLEKPSVRLSKKIQPASGIPILQSIRGTGKARPQETASAGVQD